MICGANYRAHCGLVVAPIARIAQDSILEMKLKFLFMLLPGPGTTYLIELKKLTVNAGCKNADLRRLPAAL